MATDTQEKLFTETDAEPSPTPVLRMATCKHCGKEMPYRKGKEFCSDVCRAKNGKLKNKSGSSNETDTEPKTKQTHLVARLDGIPAQAQWIIHRQESEISELKAQIKKEQEKREAAEKQVVELKEEIKDAHHDASLKGLQEASQKPTVFEQILGVIQTLPPEVTAQGATRLLDGISNIFSGAKKAVGEMGGVGGQLDEPMQNLVTNWYSALNNDNKAALHLLLDHLSKIPNEAALKAKLIQLSSAVATPAGGGPPHMFKTQMYGTY
jgi:hypothetical protein